MKIREMSIEDYDLVMELWGICEGIGLSEADSREGISQYLQRNPGMSCVAQNGNGIVGAVLCGHDGRRGFLHHLAVNRGYRRKGIGSQMVRLCLERLASAGIDKCHLFVHTSNDEGSEFWTRLGWQKRDNLDIMSIATEAGKKGA